MNSRPRVALVGCGWFASTAHIPALRRLEADGRIEVVALCSKSEESLSRAGKEFRSASLRKYTEIQTLLADPEIDVVDLVLPIPTMPKAIRASLQAGKNIISEKPCARTVSECLELLAFHAGLSNPPVWAVAENWRFKKTTQTVEKIVKSGAIGTVHFADFRHLAFAPPGNQTWRASPDYPGGYLLDSGVHFVALLRRVIGEVECVTATVSQHQTHLPPVDSVTSVLSFFGGAEGCFRLSFAAEEPNTRQPGLSLVGSKGAVYANFRHNYIEVHDSAGKRFVDVPDDTWVQGGVYEVLAHCVETLRLGTTLRSSPWEALRDVAVIEAMLESSRIGKPVEPSSLYPVLHGYNRKIDTYEGVWTFKPQHVIECSSISDVRSAVVKAVSAGLRVRAMGAGNSWATHLLTRDVCLKLSGLNRIHSVDTTRKTVLVDAGVRLGDLTRMLATHGLSLPSLSFLPDVTVGGAIATGTHGTSPKWGALSDFVRSMKVVLASGEVRKFEPESSVEELHAARVAIGMLGVIVELELQVVNMPWVRFSELRMDLATFLLRQQSILARYEHVWAHWLLGQNEIRLECLESRTKSAKGFHQYVIGDNACWNPRAHGSIQPLAMRCARSIFHRIRSLCGASLRPVPLAIAEKKEQQVWMSMQYGVSVDRCEQAIESIRSSDFAKLHSGRVVELKFLKGENQSYLGPNAGGDAVLFNLWWQVDESIKYSVFEPFEAVMRSLNARPHWGKLHRPPDISYMRVAYPQWAEFEAVRARLDPGGTFSIFSEHQP